MITIQAYSWRFVVYILVIVLVCGFLTDWIAGYFDVDRRWWRLAISGACAVVLSGLVRPFLRFQKG